MDIPCVRQLEQLDGLPPMAMLFDHLADAVYLIDPRSSRIVWGNRAAWRMLGLSREEVLDHSVLSLQRDVAGLPQWSEIAEVIRQNPVYTFIGRHRRHDGGDLQVEVNTTHFSHHGQDFFLSVARDITQRVALGQDMKNREAQLWFILNETADGLWDWTIASGALFFSPQMKRMLGYGPDEMPPVIETWSRNVHPDDLDGVMRVLKEHLAGKNARYEAEYRLRNRNGHYLWVHDRGKICERDEQGEPLRMVGIVQDITDRKLLELRLHEIASSDTLTGLANRRQGERFLESQLKLCQRLGLPLGVCFMDIDHFKSINDVHGHPTGDAVLREIAAVASAAVRGSDLICRWGGEEFIIISPNAAREEIRLIAEKIRLAIFSAGIGPRLAHRPITVSLGAAVYPTDGASASELIAQADMALYRAKHNGRNRVALAEPVTET